MSLSLTRDYGHFDVNYTAKTTVNSPNFLVWIFCGKTQFSQSLKANRPKLCGNRVFPQIFHTKKLGKITVFIAVLGNTHTSAAVIVGMRRIN